MSSRPLDASPATPRLLWFATLGGATAWSVHLVAGWGMEEIACGPVNDAPEMLGVGLGTWVGVGAVLIPGLATVAALLLAWRYWRRAEQAREHDPDDDRLGRVSFMASFGLLSNGLFLLIIIYGGVLLLFLEPCAQ